MISTATTIGRTHRLMQQNRQDAAVAGQPSPDIAFGLVCDGCGGKHGTAVSHNEVGAQLLSQFAGRFLHTALSHHPNVPLERLIAQLFRASQRYLHRQIALLPGNGQTEFMATHLLATLVGFVVTPHTAVCFWQGDGLLAINGRVFTLDADNRPDYLAYHAWPTVTPPPFGMMSIAHRADLRWLAVATDGWHAADLCQLEQPRPSLLLQRWLNVRRRENGRFEDDGAVAVWHQDDN